MSVRFAPSPTGRFHVGNLRTAWISHAWAQALGLPWILRFEDIDRPRVVAGAREAQLADMKALGLEASAPPRLQSASQDRHWEVFERAHREKKIYPCYCTRREIQAGLASAPHGAPGVYNGHCRRTDNNGALSPDGNNPTVAWRFRNANDSGVHDFVVARTAHDVPDAQSFLPTYQWACAIDDYDGNHSLLVRAWDLEASLPYQRDVFALLCAWEGAKVAPAVFHTTLVVQNNGQRLEKRTRGVTLAELWEQGWSSQRVREALENSFRARVEDFAPSRSFGEALKTMTLSQLGF